MLVAGAYFVLQWVRGGQTLASPAGDFRVEAHDRLVLVGTAERFAAAAHLFRPPAVEQVGEPSPSST